MEHNEKNIYETVINNKNKIKTKTVATEPPAVLHIWNLI